MGRRAQRRRGVPHFQGPRDRGVVYRRDCRLILHGFVVSAYIELHAASAFSFLQGASLPEALVDRAAELGYSALALLDRDGVYGAPRFHKAALAVGLRPIIGAELTIGPGGAGKAPPVPPWTLSVLCESPQGYQ